MVVEGVGVVKEEEAMRGQHRKRRNRTLHDDALDR